MVKGLPSYAGTCAVAVVRCPAGSPVLSVNDTLFSTNPLGTTDYAARSLCAWLIQIFDGGSNASVLLPEQSDNLSVPVSLTGTQPGGSLLVASSSDVSDQMAGVQAMVTFVPGACPPNSNGASVLLNLPPLPLAAHVVAVQRASLMSPG